MLLFRTLNGQANRLRLRDQWLSILNSASEIENDGSEHSSPLIKRQQRKMNR